MMLFVQEMVWNIMHDVDLETAKATTLEKRVSHKLQEFPFSKFLLQEFQESNFHHTLFFAPGSILGIIRADRRSICLPE